MSLKIRSAYCTPIKGVRGQEEEGGSQKRTEKQSTKSTSVVKVNAMVKVVDFCLKRVIVHGWPLLADLTGTNWHLTGL